MSNRDNFELALIDLTNRHAAGDSIDHSIAEELHTTYRLPMTWSFDFVALSPFAEDDQKEYGVFTEARGEMIVYFQERLEAGELDNLDNQE